AAAGKARRGRRRSRARAARCLKGGGSGRGAAPGARISDPVRGRDLARGRLSGTRAVRLSILRRHPLEAPGDDNLRFRCRIGHAFGSETLLAEQSQSLDASLAAALRALHERADLAKRVGLRLHALGAEARAERYDRIVEESERDALVIRRVLLNRDDADS